MTPRARYTTIALAWAYVGPHVFTKDADLTAWAMILLAFAGLASAAWATASGGRSDDAPDVRERARGAWDNWTDEDHASELAAMAELRRPAPPKPDGAER